MQLKRTLPDAEDVRALTTQHLADKAATVSRAAHDLLDRYLVLGQSKNGGVGLLPAQVSFILDPLCGGEQVGIDRHSTNCRTDLPYGFAHGIEEGAAGILHQMPTVSDLGRPRQRLGRRQSVAATSIACDDLDLRLI